MKVIRIDEKLHEQLKHEAHREGRTLAWLVNSKLSSSKKVPNKISETIDDYDILTRAKEFESLPISLAHSMSLFFSQIVGLYTNLTLLFSNQESNQALIQKQIDIVENMLKKQDGKGWLTRCATGLLRIYIKSIKRKLHRLYTSTQ